MHEYDEMNSLIRNHTISLNTVEEDEDVNCCVSFAFKYILTCKISFGYLKYKI